MFPRLRAWPMLKNARPRGVEGFRPPLALTRSPRPLAQTPSRLAHTHAQRALSSTGSTGEGPRRDESETTFPHTFAYGFHAPASATASPTLRRLAELDGARLQDLACGMRHCVAVVGGRIVVWGANDSGQCGPVNESLWASMTLSNARGDEDDVPRPTLLTDPFPAETRFRSVACGLWHNLALEVYDPKTATSSDPPPRLFAWGAGILGHGREVYDIAPAPIDQFELMAGRARVRDIACGAHYAAVVVEGTRPGSEADQLFVWGYLPADDDEKAESKSADNSSEGALLTTSRSLHYHKVFRPTQLVMPQNGTGHETSSRITAVACGLHQLAVVLEQPSSRQLLLFGRASGTRSTSSSDDDNHPYCPLFVDQPPVVGRHELALKLGRPVRSYTLDAKVHNARQVVVTCNGTAFVLDDAGQLFKTSATSNALSAIHHPEPFVSIADDSQLRDTATPSLYAVTRDTGRVLKRNSNADQHDDSWQTVYADRDMSMVRTGFDFAVFGTDVSCSKSDASHATRGGGSS